GRDSRAATAGVVLRGRPRLGARKARGHARPWADHRRGVRGEEEGAARPALVDRRAVVSCRLADVEGPNVHYVRNGDVAVPYQVFGDGPVDLVYAPQWINNLEIAWSNRLNARFLSRLGSFARVVFVDRRGMGLSDRLPATDVPPLETLVEDLRVVIDA